MALNNTYAGLQASIADFLNRTDLTAAIPDFVVLCEAQLNRAIRCQAMIKRNNAFAITGQSVSAPTDFIAPRRLALIGATTPLALSWVSCEQMDDLLDNDDYTSAQPKHYTVEGGNILFSPNPGTGTYTASLSYYAAIPPLASNTTNWLLTRHPDVYLYGALLQSAPYLKDDERLQTWTQLYQAGVAAINEQDLGMGGALETMSGNFRSGGVW